MNNIKDINQNELIEELKNINTYDYCHVIEEVTDPSDISVMYGYTHRYRFGQGIYFIQLHFYDLQYVVSIHYSLNDSQFDIMEYIDNIECGAYLEEDDEGYERFCDIVDIDSNVRRGFAQRAMAKLILNDDFYKEMEKEIAENLL